MDSASAKIHKTGTDDGWHGVISPEGQFPPQSGRYHLYIGLFCPFAHRANLVRHLKGLTDVISISVVKPYPKGNDKGWPGWVFPSSHSEYPNATVDHLYGSKYLHEIYFKADAEYKGRYSVPVLWDSEAETIVNNESAELLRWLPHAFDSISPKVSSHPPPPLQHDLDLYPEAQRAEIDAVTAWIQPDLNSGVYKAGFATDQKTYDANVPVVFRALNRLEKLIASHGGPFILGEHQTELDIRAYATIVRFDAIYVQHFKCNLGTIRHDYPVINNWLKYLYWQVSGYKESTDFTHIKENYTKSHVDINPRAITPLGPLINVESGYEKDVGKLRIGHLDIPE